MAGTSHKAFKSVSFFSLYLVQLRSKSDYFILEGLVTWNCCNSPLRPNLTSITIDGKYVLFCSRRKTGSFSFHDFVSFDPTSLKLKNINIFFYLPTVV